MYCSEYQVCIIASMFLWFTAPGIADCNFESSSFCKWTQDKDDKFNWSIGRGGTSSGSTGPSIDNTKKTCE